MLKGTTAIGLAVALALSAASAARAQDKPIELKFAGWAPPQINVNIVSQQWGKDVEKASGGKVRVKFFWNSIANVRTVYDVVRTGVADVGWILQPLVRGKFKKSGVVALPFLVNNATEGSVAIWQLYERGLIKDEYDQVKPLAIVTLPPSIIHSKPKITTLADIAGKKFRIAGRENAQIISLLKGTGVQMGITDVYQAINKGVIDASLSPWLGYTAFKHDEVTRYHMEVPMGAIAGMTSMNMKTWESLPAEAKAAIEKVSYAPLARAYGEISDKDVAQNRARVAAQKDQIIGTFSEADIAKMKEILKPVEADWIKNTPNGAAVVAAMKEELEKARK